MHKFFDYLVPELPVTAIRDLLGYIRGVGFCATEQDPGSVRVHWVQVGRQRIPLDATV